MARILKRNWGPVLAAILFAGTCIWVAGARGATDWYVSTSGSGVACTIGSPCPLAAGVCGSPGSGGCQGGRSIPASGDTIWLEAGIYAVGPTGINVQIQTPSPNGVPITIRNYNNGYVAIDCKGVGNSTNCFGVQDTSQYIKLWGLNFINSSTQVRQGTSVVGPSDMSETVFAGNHLRVINCFFRDQIDGFESAGGTFGGTNRISGNRLFRGNFLQYNGYVGQTGEPRSYGHNQYLQNTNLMGEPGRSTFTQNVGLRSFQVGTQIYSTGSTVPISYITWSHNVEGVSGHQAVNFAWDDTNLWNNLYPGTDGAAAGSCGGSNKVLYSDIIDTNYLYSKISEGVPFGGSKGSCISQFTNNLIGDAGGISFTPSNTFTPLTITGNTFPFVGNNTGGPAALFNQTNYPTNTWLPSIPVAGSWGPFYEPNVDEVGRGFAVVYNWGHAANITINLDSMGGYAGEQYKVFNWQDNDPWNSTPIATGTCGATCGTISVSSTTSSIFQPGLTTDGSTLFPKPNDIGPEFVVYHLYPNWSAAAGTPSPTNTNTQTFTSTPSNTPTLTNTPTFTPVSTNTFTPTATGTIPATSTFTPTRTSTATFTPQASPTPTVTPSANGLRFSVNTVPCVIGGNGGSITADAAALGGYYFSTGTANSGTLTCTVNLPTGGIWYMWAQVYGATSLSDSFFLSVNGDQGLAATATPTGSNTPTKTNTPTATPTGTLTPTPTQVNPAPTRTYNPVGMGDGDTTNLDIFDVATNYSCTLCQINNNWNNAYQYNQLNDRSYFCPNCGTNTQGVLRTMSLSAGINTFAFRGREVGARLSYIILTQDPNYNPNVPPTPVPSGSCPYSFLCKGGAVMVMGPCNQPVINPCPAGN